MSSSSSNRRVDSSFSDSRNILDFVPDIKFVEPDQIFDAPPNAKETGLTLDDSKDAIDELIKQYELVEELSDAAQKNIDAMASSICIKVDRDQDGVVVHALKRLDQGGVVSVASQQLTNPNNDEINNNTLDENLSDCISYSMYKKCIEEINKTSFENMSNGLPTEEDILAVSAGGDSFGPEGSNGTQLSRDTFGAMNLASGLKRPELDKNVQAIKPINLNKFKRDMILALFKSITGMIIKLTITIVKKFLFPF